MPGRGDINAARVLNRAGSRLSEAAVPAATVAYEGRRYGGLFVEERGGEESVELGFVVILSAVQDRRLSE